MLFFAESDVRRLLPMDRAIEVLRRALVDLAAGQAQNQPRRRLVLPNGAMLHSMAGAFGPYFGTKIYSTHPRHGAHFLFVLYRAEDGVPLALFEANYLGQIRTGAASGLATDLLAPPDAGSVALIGAGFQARSQLEAVLKVRPARSVRVWSRTQDRLRDFVRECSQAFAAPIQAAGSAEEAVRGAEVIVTATNSRDPVLDDGWVAPGTHVNAIGSNHPMRRELPGELVRRAALVAVDSIEQARIESGDLLLAFQPADWQSSRLVELQDVASGSVSRPGSPDAITIFKSNGLGVEDVAAAGYVYESAARGEMNPVPVFHS